MPIEQSGASSKTYTLAPVHRSYRICSIAFTGFSHDCLQMAWQHCILSKFVPLYFELEAIKQPWCNIAVCDLACKDLSRFFRWLMDGVWEQPHFISWNRWGWQCQPSVCTTPIPVQCLFALGNLIHKEICAEKPSHSCRNDMPMHRDNFPYLEWI